MKILNVTKYKKKYEWGLNIYTSSGIKNKIPFKSLEEFIEENICKLSNYNIQYLRKLSQKNVPIELYEFEGLNDKTRTRHWN